MARDDSEKVYWMKLYKDFPSQYKLRALANMRSGGRGLNGREIFTIAIFMMCESIPYRGELRFSDSQPYTIERLANVLCFPCKDVQKTVEVLQEYEILSIKNDGTMVFECVANNFGETTKGAIRKHKTRDSAVSVGTNVPKSSPECPALSPNVRHTRASRESIEYRDIDIKKPPTVVGGKESGLTPADDDGGGREDGALVGSLVGESTFAPQSRHTANRTPATREDVERYIAFVNEKCNTKVSEQVASDFWDYVMMRNTDPSKTIVTKESIGRTLHAFLQIRKKTERESAKVREKGRDIVDAMHHITSEEIQAGLKNFDEEEAEYERRNAEARAKYERELAEARARYGVPERATT